MINWKIRFKNWLWVSSFVSQVMLVVQMVLIFAHAQGWTDYQITDDFKGWVMGLANAIFILLSMLGIVQDPTVEGLGDSAKALRRDEPLSETQKKNS